MNKKPEFRAWYHTLPGVVAAIGWYFVFKSASWIVGYINQPWWARALIVGAMLLVTLGAGMFCWSITMPVWLRKRKGAGRQAPDITPDELAAIVNGILGDDGGEPH